MLALAVANKVAAACHRTGLQEQWRSLMDEWAGHVCNARLSRATVHGTATRSVRRPLLSRCNVEKAIMWFWEGLIALHKGLLFPAV